jgi:hypothetical protein
MCCFDAIDNSRTHYTRSYLLCYKTDLLLLFASMPSSSDVCGQFLIVIQSISLRFSCLHTAPASSFCWKIFVRDGAVYVENGQAGFWRWSRFPGSGPSATLTPADPGSVLWDERAVIIIRRD